MKSISSSSFMFLIITEFTFTFLKPVFIAILIERSVDSNMSLSVIAINFCLFNVSRLIFRESNPHLYRDSILSSRQVPLVVIPTSKGFSFLREHSISKNLTISFLINGSPPVKRIFFTSRSFTRIVINLINSS